MRSRKRTNEWRRVKLAKALSLQRLREESRLRTIRKAQKLASGHPSAFHSTGNPHETQSQKPESAGFGRRHQVGFTTCDVDNSICQLRRRGMEQLRGGSGYHVSIKELTGERSGKLKDEPPTGEAATAGY